MAGKHEKNKTIDQQERINRLKELSDLGKRTKAVIAVIDSWKDLEDEDKADLYDNYMLRLKGKLPKSNQWRK